MRPMLTVAAIALLVYVAGFGALYAFQERLVFFPTRTLGATPAAVGLPFEDVRLETDDGIDLHGWFVPHPGARYTVLFLHGNAGNVSHRLDSLALLHEAGLSVLIVDYRGYGRSGGTPTEEGTYRDAAAAWRHLTERRGIAPERVVLLGRSLGGAVAAWLAMHRRPAAVILESTFTSGAAMARRMAPIYPARLLARLRYDSLARVPRLQAPVLVVHSRRDEIIPFAHGRALYGAAPEPKRMLEIDGAHNTGFLDDRARYRAGLEAFLAELTDMARERRPSIDVDAACERAH